MYKCFKAKSSWQIGLTRLLSVPRSVLTLETSCVCLSVCGVSLKGPIKLPGLLSFSIQIDVSCLSFEGHQFQGKKAIMDKLNVSLHSSNADGVFISWFEMYIFAVILGFLLCLLWICVLKSDFYFYFFLALCVTESSLHKNRAYYNSTRPPTNPRLQRHEYGGRTAEGT